MHGIYFWSAVVGFFLGVAYAVLHPLGFAFAALLVGVGIVAWVVSRKKYAIVLAIIFCMAGVGALRVAVSDTRIASVLDNYVEERVTLEGKIIDEPDKRETSVRLTVLPYMVVPVSGEGVELGRAPRMLVPAPLPAAFSYGDIVRVQGILKRPEAFETDSERVFDYPNYLAARNIYFDMPFSEVEKIEDGGVSARGILFDIKNAYLFGLQRTLPEPHASLAGGITVGDKRSLGEKLTEQFRRTGLVHIVVLSGYNITLIVGALMLAIRRTPLTWRFIIGGSMIVAFVLMTGASPTGVRAGAMAVLALLAAASYRKYAITRALALTAAGMVMWNPHVLLYDPGFQLSVIATIGLIHIAPLFEKKLWFFPKRFELRGIAAATLGTQFAVLPLLLYQMGLLSFVSVPTNLLILPIIPAAMIASFVAGIIGAIFGPIYGTIGMVAGLPAYALLEYAIRVTEFFANIPLGAVELPAFSGWFVVVAYAVGVVILWRRTS